MRNKILSASACMCILSLAGLLFLAICAEKRQYQDLSIIVPAGSGLPSFDLRDINKTGNEEMAVTYDIKKRATAESANSAQPVTMIGTNSSYADIFGLQVLEGDFLSAETWTMGNRYVMLNEPAAFRMFGSSNIIGNTLKLDGEVWMVTGIVKDGNKKNMVAYVPASVITGVPEVLMAKTEGGTGTVLNNLRRLGIYESNCKVIDVAAVARLFWQQFIACIYLSVGLLSLMYTGKKISVLKEYWGWLRLRYQIMYLDKLMIKSRREIKQMACQSLLMIVSIMTSLLLARQILEMALGWKDIGSKIKYLSDYFFQGKMQWLMRYLISGPILCSVFIISLFMMVVSFITSSKGTSTQYRISIID